MPRPRFTAPLPRRWILIWFLFIALGAAGTLGVLSAAEPKQEEKSKLLRDLSPVSIFAPEENRHILELEAPVRRSRDESEHLVHSIYFPPNPPPLGIELSLRSVDARVGAPPELAPYVMEPFYAPLSTRLIERSLTRKQDAQLADYMARKAECLQALRARLAEVANIGPHSRLLALEEFAAQQAPTLATLEREADSLRREFYTVPAGSAGAGWYEWRGWKLGRGRLDLPREETFFFEGQLLRGAAFYQEGLTPAQRELLRECAIALESVVFPDERAQGPSAHDWFWFFSPHLAQIHLPDDDLPDELKSRIATFRAQKDALKTVLRDAIYFEDRAVFASSRREQLAALAAEQTAPIAALEETAEKIRRELARVAPQPAPRLPPPLPDEINDQIERYTREKKALERELAENVRRAVRHMRVPPSYELERSALKWNAARLEAIDRARARWREKNAARLDALKLQLADLRAAIEAWAGPPAKGAVAPRGTSGSFLRDFFAQRSEQQGRYECHLAVFEPGLSPEQRRLLFQAGVAALNLPLPGPEEQPTSLPGTILK